MATTPTGSPVFVTLAKNSVLYKVQPDGSVLPVQTQHDGNTSMADVAPFIGSYAGYDLVVELDSPVSSITATGDNFSVVEIKGADYLNTTHRIGISGLSLAGTNVKCLISANNGVTYNSLINGAWTTVSLDCTLSAGMDNVALAAITAAQWSALFVRGQFALAIAVPYNGEFISATLSLPANAAPTIVSIAMNPTATVHIDGTLSAVITDPEGDSIQYRTWINGVLYSGWSEELATPVYINDDIAQGFLQPAPTPNTIKIDAMDEVGNVTSSSITVQTSESKPVVTVQTSTGRDFRALITDADGDNVSYTLRLHDVAANTYLTVQHKELLSVPYLIDYVPGDTVLTPGSKYEYILDVNDNTGSAQATATVTVPFTAVNYGFLFFNHSPAQLLVDERGNITNLLMMGQMYVGKLNSSVFQIDLYNYTDYDVTNINLDAIVSSDGMSAAADTAKTTVRVYFDDTGNFPVLQQSLSYGAMVLKKGQSVTFYIQADIDAKADLGMKTVRLRALGQAIQ